MVFVFSWLSIVNHDPVLITDSFPVHENIFAIIPNNSQEKLTILCSNFSRVHKTWNRSIAQIQALCINVSHQLHHRTNTWWWVLKQRECKWIRNCTAAEIRHRWAKDIPTHRKESLQRPSLIKSIQADKRIHHKHSTLDLHRHNKSKVSDLFWLSDKLSFNVIFGFTGHPSDHHGSERSFYEIAEKLKAARSTTEQQEV